MANIEIKTEGTTKVVEVSNPPSGDYLAKINPTGSGLVSINRHELAPAGDNSVTLNGSKSIISLGDHHYTDRYINNFTMTFQSYNRDTSTLVLTCPRNEGGSALVNYALPTLSYVTLADKTSASGRKERSLKLLSRTTSSDPYVFTFRATYQDIYQLHLSSGSVCYAIASDIFAYNLASGKSSIAVGVETQAVGECSHAEGRATIARNKGTHAEGYSAVAEGQYSHAEGYQTIAESNYSHAEGQGTVAASQASHAQGKFNVISDSTAFVVGNGTDESHRSNALAVDWNGNVAAAGDVTANGGQISLSGLNASLANRANIQQVQFSATSDSTGDASIGDAYAYNNGNGYALIAVDLDQGNLLYQCFHGTYPNFIHLMNLDGSVAANTSVTGRAYLYKF